MHASARLHTTEVPILARSKNMLRIPVRSFESASQLPRQTACVLRRNYGSTIGSPRRLLSVASIISMKEAVKSGSTKPAMSFSPEMNIHMNGGRVDEYHVRDTSAEIKGYPSIQSSNANVRENGRSGRLLGHGEGPPPPDDNPSRSLFP